MTALRATTFTRNPDALAGPGSSKGGPPGNGITMPRAVEGWTNSIVPGAFHDNSSPTAHLGAASAWNLTRSTAGIRKNLANIIPAGAVNKRTPNGMMSFDMFSGTPYGGYGPLSPGSITGAVPTDTSAKSAGIRDWLIRHSIIVGGPFDNNQGPFSKTKPGTPNNPTTPSTPSTPATPGPTGTPIDPGLQALASLFGAGASGAQPGAMLSTQPVNPTSSGGASGIVILGALAGIAGLIYLWWSHHKKAA
jgi:hypothetical protein